MSDRLSQSNNTRTGTRIWSRRAVLTAVATGIGGLAACGRNRSAPEAEPTAAPTPSPVPREVDASIGNRAIERAGSTAGSGVSANQPVALPTITPTPTGPTLPHRLVIPRIDLDIPVVELGWSTNRSNSNAIFSEWDVAAHAAGWHKNSALPGQAGNVVMSGHNNILGAVFRQLDQLRKDDEISVYSGTTRHVYKTERVLIVPETRATDEQRMENAKWIAPTPQERLTLVSCWPRNDNTHRIIVVARPHS